MVTLYNLSSTGDIEKVKGKSLREIYRRFCKTLSIAGNRSKALYYDAEFDKLAMGISLYDGNSRIFDKNGKVIYRA